LTDVHDLDVPRLGSCLERNINPGGAVLTQYESGKSAMTRRVTALSAIALLISSSAAYGATLSSSGYGLRLSVPVLCTLRHQAALMPVANGYQLGELLEYCNAPGGYNVQVSYTPGSMRGAVVMVGDEQVTLDGSGETIVSRAPGPRIRDRAIIARPGPAGFDTDRLNFDIVAN